MILQLRDGMHFRDNINIAQKQPARRLIVPTLCLIALLQGCAVSKYAPEQKIPPKQLQNDVAVLQKTLQQNHPGLYWYATKASIDNAFNALEESAKDSLTQLSFHNNIARMLATIQCGHTAVRFSKQYISYLIENRYPMFPLYLYNWENHLYVLKNMHSKDPNLIRGLEVSAINNISAQQIIDSLYQYISADANNHWFKAQVISNNFPAWYKMIFGLDTAYQIQYIDTMGVQRSIRIKNYSPKEDTTQQKAKIIRSSKAYPLPPKKLSALQQKRSLSIDSLRRFAYMHVGSFSGGRLRGFFRRSFRELHKMNIPNLIIDVRGNGGGNVSKSVLLTKYLIQKPFKVADTAASVHRTMWDKSYIVPWWLYWFPMQWGSVKGADRLFHAKRIETHIYRPKLKKHFNGHIFLLQDGYTFSAAAMFTGSLKGHPNVQIAGTPSGGAYYGNNALFLPHLKLPNSKLRITLPMYRVVLDSARPKNGKGVLPDIWVQPQQRNHLTLPPNALQEVIFKIVQNK
ncbi:S41 family peptidase [Hydrotalea sp.]|uniref:S41 family peptidase n=1 Tax=Hydrotalea sp. TaxID=2881279 RepID=UPI003D10BF1D